MNFRKEPKDIFAPFVQYQKVAYKPLHAYGDINHPDIEYGFVSSINEKVVFVKFVKQLAMFSWSGTTSQACDPDSLTIIHGQFWPQVTN
jgi:hypothetical protein